MGTAIIMAYFLGLGPETGIRIMFYFEEIKFNF